MAGNVVAAFRRRDADAVETSNYELGGAINRLAVFDRVGAQVQAQIFHVEAIVGVVEDLVEVAHAEE